MSLDAATDDLRSSFKLAMRRFPAAVTVITSADQTRRHGMTAVDQRADGQERIAVAGFEDASESGVDIGRNWSVLVPIDKLICRRRGKLWRRRDF